MGGFSVDKKFYSAVGFANDESIKKRYFSIFLFLVGEFYAISGIGLIEMVSEILDLSLFDYFQNVIDISLP